MSGVIKRVMDKNGDHLYGIYCDGNNYAMNCLLSKFSIDGYHGSCYRYSVVLFPDHKRIESKYDNICKTLQIYYDISHHRDNLETLIRNWEILKSAVTEDTYYVLHALESDIDHALREAQFRYNFRSGPRPDIEFSRTATDNEKIHKSVLILTENFKDNPIQAFVRFKYLHNIDIHTSTCIEILDTYWIYAFSSLNILKKYIKFLPVEKLNIDKILRYTQTQYGFFETDEIIKLTYSHVSEYYREKIESLERDVEFFKKEAEDILAPGGSIYEAAKENFEKNAATLISPLDQLDDELILFLHK